MIKYKDPQGNIKEIEGRLFICKDTKDNDVFAEDSFIYDCCGNFHEKGTGFFVWDEDILGFRLQDTIKKKRVFYFGVDFSCSDIELIEAVAQTKDITAHPFVCKDKKDKDVWKGDQTNKGIAIASFESWVWTYTKDFSTYHWHISIRNDIELIEDKND